MSDQQPARPSEPSARLDPMMRLILVVIGVILLLPGLCSVVISVIMIQDGWLRAKDFDSTIMFGVLIFLAAGAGGVTLIAFAIRR